MESENDYQNNPHPRFVSVDNTIKKVKLPKKPKGSRSSKKKGSFVLKSLEGKIKILLILY